MKIHVVGDLMEDEDVFVEQLGYCPASGAPRYKVRNRSLRPGGAGNAAMMLVGLGQRVSLEAPGAEYSRVARTMHGVDILQSDDSHVATRSRYFHTTTHQCLWRVDADPPLLGGEPEEVIMRPGDADGLLISDYSLTGNRYVMPATGWQMQVVANVKAPLSVRWDGLPDTAILVCNYPDAVRAVRQSDAAVSHNPYRVINHLIEKTNKRIVMTCGESAVYYSDSRHNVNRRLVPRVTTSPQVIGAGDMFSAALLSELASNTGLDVSIESAIAAAAAHVKLPRSVPVSAEEWRQEYRQYSLANKRLRQSATQEPVETVFTNGCFDLLHPGHQRLLGSCTTTSNQELLVAVNSDASVRELKGEARPFRPVENRLLDVAYAIGPMVRARVIEFDGDVDGLLRDSGISPVLLVKGAEYEGTEVPGASRAKEVRFCPQLEGWSTTELASRTFHCDANGM